MKNTLLYYLIIILPLATIALAAKYHLISSGEFVVLFFLYVLIYRPIVDIARLNAKGVIKSVNFRAFRNYLFFGPVHYFKELYLP